MCPEVPEGAALRPLGSPEFWPEKVVAWVAMGHDVVVPTRNGMRRIPAHSIDHEGADCD